MTMSTSKPATDRKMNWRYTLVTCILLFNQSEISNGDSLSPAVKEEYGKKTLIVIKRAGELAASLRLVQVRL
jgi:hypothetical protein